MTFADDARRAVEISHTAAAASLTVSLGSIVYGVVRKAMQQITLTMIDDPLLDDADRAQDHLPAGSGLTDSERDVVARLREKGFRLTKSGRGDFADGAVRELSAAELEADPNPVQPDLPSLQQGGARGSAAHGMARRQLEPEPEPEGDAPRASGVSRPASPERGLASGLASGRRGGAGLPPELQGAE